MTERNYGVGDHVIYVDPVGKEHPALVTIWWGPKPTEGKQEPGCNVVYVSSDGEKKDTYGRQIERATSVVHQGSQPAYGHFWKWPDQ